MPKVSIVVTTFNVESYIRDTLSGIAGQTLKDIEIIVVDDGSTDGTRDIVREFAADDPRMKLIFFDENTIGGVASAANAGIEAATGDFIGFADGDDLYDPTMFETLYVASIEADADLAMSQYWVLDTSTGRKSEPADEKRWSAFPSRTTLTLNERTRKELLRFISVPWRKLYRRDLVERADLRFPVGDFFFEDNPFHWASVIGAQRVVMIPEKLCEHRVVRAGQTMSSVDERLLRIFHHHDIIRDWLVENDCHAEYKIELLRWVAAQLSWVSERATGEVRRLLFDRLVPVVGQYSLGEIFTFKEEVGRNRSSRMIEALKREDYDAFAQAAGWNEQRRKGLAGASGFVAAQARGVVKFAVRDVGPFAYHRLGLKYLPFVRGLGREGEAVDNEDLMAALVILQQDVRRLNARLDALQTGQDAETTETVQAVAEKKAAGSDG